MPALRQAARQIRAREGKPASKGDETRRKILGAALSLFQERGFDAATMREIAVRAQVATGAAYYYFPSKEAIVIEFYLRSCEEMQPIIEEALRNVRGLQNRLQALIAVKLDYFALNRGVLRALLKSGA